MDRKKMRISEMDGKHIDSAVVSCPADAEKVLTRWKLKGLL
jgi:hypothetical protein